MASTFAEKNQEFAKSTKDNAAQSGKKKKQSPFQGMYYCLRWVVKFPSTGKSLSHNVSTDCSW